MQDELLSTVIVMVADWDNNASELKKFTKCFNGAQTE
jgi:hypothetical protein